MKVLVAEMRPGDIVVFPRRGPVAFVLGGILRLIMYSGR